MDSQSLLNGMKDLFASLGAKTSDSSYAVPLVNSSTGEPKGFMSMANLASVLGAFIGIGLKRVTPSSSAIDFNSSQYGASNQFLVSPISSSTTIANGYKGQSAQTYDASVLVQIGNDTAGIMIHAAYDLSWLYIRVGYSAWRSWKKISLT